MGVSRVGGRFLTNLIGSVAVLTVAGAIALGLPVLDRRVPGAVPVAAGRPYEVGGGVRLVPPPGALVDVTKTRPWADRGTVLFLVGPVRYLVVVTPFAGDLPDAARRLRGKITSLRGSQVVGPEYPVTIGSALAGVGGGYTAPGRVGRYLVLLNHRKTIEVTVSGTRADIDGLLETIEASIHTLTCRAIW